MNKEEGKKKMKVAKNPSKFQDAYTVLKLTTGNF